MTVHIEFGVPFLDYFNTRFMELTFDEKRVTLENIVNYLMENYAEERDLLAQKGYITKEGAFKAIYAVGKKVVYDLGVEVCDGEKVKILSHMLGG